MGPYRVFFNQVMFFFPFYFQASKLGGRTFALYAFVMGALGSKESDVGEVQSDDGFYVRKSRKRSRIEPRQYHFLYDHDHSFPQLTAFPLITSLSILLLA